MAALLDATREQIDALGAVTDTLVSVERTISSLLAARDGLLALGNRIALETAAAARTDDGSPYLGHDGADLAVRAVAAEFGAALRVSDRTVQRRMADADLLVTLFPAVWRAQGAGDISPAHARAIVDAGMHLEGDAERDAYTAEILEYAAEESPNRVRRHARRIAERHQRRTIDERHRAARADRAVWVKDLGDGMAELGLHGPAALVHGAFDRLTSITKTVRDGIPVTGEHEAVPSAAGASEERIPEVTPDTRTLAQARCDLALDLLLSGAPSGHGDPDGAVAAIRGSVSITVPVLTLMGVTTTPAEIDGHAPIDAHRPAARGLRTRVGSRAHAPRDGRRGGRRSLPSLSRPEAPRARSRSAMPFPLLRLPRPRLRSRSHPGPCAGRGYLVRQSVGAVPTPPRAEASQPVARGESGRWLPCVDEPRRARVRRCSPGDERGTGSEGRRPAVLTALLRHSREARITSSA